MLASCPIATGGRCLEGFQAPQDECPNFSDTALEADLSEATEDDEQDEEVESGTRQPLASHGVEIHFGKELTAEEASQIARSRLTRVITIAGLAESGKSALVTCAFHRLLDGPFADFAFAGSDSLVAFEERCHRARVTSRRTAPTMERTTGALTETEFLHLRLAQQIYVEGGPVRLEAPRDLLLTDVPGETFRHARDNVEDARLLKVLHRTDRLAILLDGAMIADPDRRQGTARDALSLLGSLLDADMVDHSTAVDLVVTKWDLIAEAPDVARIDAFLHATAERAEAHGERVLELRWHRTAALPTRTAVPLGFGVDTLLSLWMKPSVIAPSSAPSTPASIPADAREYLRFAARHFSDQIEQSAVTQPVVAPRQARGDAR